MGNSKSDALTNRNIEELYKTIRKGPDGLTMMEEKDSGREFMLREITCNHPQEFERMMSAVEKRKEHKHEHVLAVKQTYQRVQNNFCSNDYKLYMLIEYPFRTLAEEIQERALTNEYFTQSELWSVLYSCSIALRHIYKQHKHQALSSDRVFIEKDGLVKVGDPFLLGHHNNVDSLAAVEHNRHVYLSPEQIQMLQHPRQAYNPEMSDIFTLGMVILEAASLSPLIDLYEQQCCILNRQGLSRRLDEISKRYSPRFYNTLKHMLQFSPRGRATFRQIEDAVLEEEEEQHNPKVELMTEVSTGKRIDQVQPSKTPNISQMKENIGRISNGYVDPLDKTWNRETMPSYGGGSSGFVPTSSGIAYGTQYSSSPMLMPPSLPLASYAKNVHQPSRNQYDSYASSSISVPTTYNSFGSGYGLNSNLYTPSSFMQQPMSFGASWNNYTTTPTTYSFLPTQPKSNPTSNLLKPISNLQSPPVLSSDQTAKNIVDKQAMTEQFRQALKSSPVKKDSLSPVQQLETPERKEKQVKNPAFVQNSSSSSSNSMNSAYQQVTSLLPNSTIAEVTQTEFSGSSASRSPKYQSEQYEQGSRYEGYKLNGMRHGFGKFYYQDGGYYEGQWKENKMNGFAKLFYQNGELAYQGFWKDDQFHGKGKVFNDNPKKWQGPFDFTNLSGLDECWIYYDGQFDEDSKHGHGVVKLSNGQEFEGQFQRDVIQGQGEFRTLNGETICGIWRDNRLIQRLD